MQEKCCLETKYVSNAFLKRYKGKVVIYTKSPQFDCVAKILEVKDDSKVISGRGYRVQVKRYLNGDWSSKEQFYHAEEIIRIIPIGRNMKTIEVLFGN